MMMDELDDDENMMGWREVGLRCVQLTLSWLHTLSDPAQESSMVTEMQSQLSSEEEKASPWPSKSHSFAATTGKPWLGFAYADS